MPPTHDLRSHVGHELELDRTAGDTIAGRLLNVGRRTLWLIIGDEDRFVPLDEVTAWHVATATPAPGAPQQPAA